MQNKNPKEYKSYNGTLLLTATGATIKRIGLGAGGSIRGDVSIPYSSITGIQFKKATFFSNSGYLHIIIMGGQEINSIFQAGRNENTICFTMRGSKAFEEAKEIIESRIGQGKQNGNTSFNDLEKLADLKEKGVITQKEFEQKKKQLLEI